MEKYKKLSVKFIETDLSTVKIINSSIYGIFGNCKKGPTNQPYIIDFSHKPKITYSFKKIEK